MSLSVKPGTRLFGAACQTEVIVIRASADPIDLRIGGHPALLDASQRDGSLTVTTPADAAALIGKRYINADETLELLCTKGGAGAPGVGDTLCTIKDAKPLPASD